MNEHVRPIEAQTLSDQAISAKQFAWIRKGSIGCVFSAVLATSHERGKTRWADHIVRATPEELRQTPQGEAFMQTVRTSIAEQKVELFSAIFPNITSGQNLAELITYLGNQPPFHIDEVAVGKVRKEDPTLYNGISLRAALPNGAEAWPLVLGPYDFFSASRRAPYTQLVFRPLEIKGNPTTAENQIGVDDTSVPVTAERFRGHLTRTVQSVARTRGDFNQQLFRARVAVVVPQAEWQQAQARFGVG